MPASTWACCPAASASTSPISRSAGRSTTAWRRPRRTIPGRFIGLAHVPAMKPDEARAELKRCAVDLGFPGVVIASEMQDQALDHRIAQAVLEGVLRSRPLCLHPSAGQGHQLEPDGRRRSRPHVRLGVLADDRDHPHHQLRPARRSAGPENPFLAFLRRHRALSRPLQRLPAAHQVGHLADQGPQPAAEACGRSLPRQSAVSTTAPAGPAPIRAGRSAPTG